MNKTLIALTVPVSLLLLAGGSAVAQSQMGDPATIVEMCDLNGDNALTKAEWDTCGAPTAYPESSDTDKDGKLTAVELGAKP